MTGLADAAAAGHDKVAGAFQRLARAAAAETHVSFQQNDVGFSIADGEIERGAANTHRAGGRDNLIGRRAALAADKAERALGRFDAKSLNRLAAFVDEFVDHDRCGRTHGHFCAVNELELTKASRVGPEQIVEINRRGGFQNPRSGRSAGLNGVRGLNRFSDWGDSVGLIYRAKDENGSRRHQVSDVQNMLHRQTEDARCSP